MKMGIATIILIIITGVVFVIFDIKQLISTSLSIYGVNHWIPEFISLIFIGYYITEKLGHFYAKTIAVCVLLYVILTFFLMSQPIQFSIGSGSFFVVAMLVGMLLKLKRGIRNE